MSAAFLTNSAMNSAAFAPKTGSLLRLENVAVEDVRGYGPAIVDRLRNVLAAGASFTKDYKRKRFYEVNADDERFYIHVLPGGRKIILLLHWKAPAAA